MLNLELVGVSLYSAVSLIRAFFCASPVATRYVSPFYATRIAVPRMTTSKVLPKTVGMNTTCKVEIFSADIARPCLSGRCPTFVAKKAKLRGDR